MLGNIRKKVNDVILEGISFSEGFSSNLKLYQPTENPMESLNKTTDVSLSAGTNLLHINEEIWKHLHESNEINVEKAEEIDKSITKINDKIYKIYTLLSGFNQSMESSTELIENLRISTKMLSSMQEQCEQIEQNLVALEDLCEEIDLQEKQLEHKLQTTLYKQKKMNELEEVRQNLVVQHEKNVLRAEKELKELQLERQAVFQASFQEDLQLYKEQGTIPRIKEIKNSTKLEEIVLEDDDENKKNLESFLNE